MVLNRKTDRRRRLLVDSKSQVGNTSVATKKSKKQSTAEEPVQTDVRKAYSIGAMRRHQRKVTDLIPKRRLAYSLSIVVFAVLLASVNLLAAFSPNWISVIGRDGVEALAITGPSSLVTYLSTVFFAVAAVLCLQIYTLRQHRCDDYEGTYRVWGWLFPAFAIASLGCVLPLVSISQNIFIAVSGRGFSVQWLPLAFGVLWVSLVLIRYLMEVRSSLGTVAWASLAWLAICVGWGMPEILSAFAPELNQSSVQDLALGNGILVAAVATLLANLTYARFVFLRSNGFIHSKPKQIKAKQTLPFRPFRERKNSRRERVSKVVAEENTEDVTPVAAEPKKSPRKTSKKAPAASKPKVAKASKAKKTVPKPATKPVPKPEPEKEQVVATAPAEEKAVDPPTKQISVSASERLKQLAAATRIQKTPQQTEQTDQQAPGVIKLSKAQRRKLRKQQKKQNRAA